MTADRPDLDLDGLREEAEQLRPAGDSSVDHLPASEWYIADVRFLHDSLLALIARVEKAEGAVARVAALMDEWDRPGLPAEVNPFVNRLVRRTRRALGADS